MSRKKVTWCGSDYEIELYQCRLKSRIFDMYLVSGRWQEDDTLVDLCNSVARGQGAVKPSDQGDPNHKIVEVFSK